MPRNSCLRRCLAFVGRREETDRPTKLAACLLLLFAAALTLRASDTNDTNTYMALSFDELLEVKVDRVYGASRFDQKISEAPASVSIVTSEEINRFGHRNLADTLRSVRGLYVTYDRNYSYLGVRGFSRPGDYNSRVLLLIDGHRMNDNLYDGCYLGTEGLLDVDLIDRIEIIRGPSSSIYGSSAFFGVINVVTKTGRQIDGVQTSVEVGDLDTYKLLATLGKRFTNDVELLFSASVYESQGQDRLHYPEFRGPTNHFGIVRNSDEDRAGRLFTSVRYHDVTVSGGVVAREKNIPTASFGSLFADGREETLDIRGYADMKYDHAFSDGSRVLARVYYDVYEYYGTYPYPNTLPAVTFFRDRAIGNWAGTEWQWTQRVFEHTLVCGIDYRHDVRQDQFNYDERPRYVYLEDKRTGFAIGAYVQAEVALTSNLIASAGVRYDYFDRFGSTANPRGALIYSPGTNTTFKALYGRAFRAPSAYELYYNPATRDLDPETIDTYELVYEQQLPAGMRFTTASYYYTVEDLIDENMSSTGMPFAENASRADAIGVEFELSGRWKHVMGRISYALQRAEDTDTGKDLSNSPRHLAKLNFNAPIYQDKIFAGLELQYNGGARTVSGHRADDFAIVNLTLFSQKLVRNLEFSASIYNLFDTKYGYPGAGDHVQEMIAQDGRGFRVKLTYRF